MRGSVYALRLSTGSGSRFEGGCGFFNAEQSVEHYGKVSITDMFFPSCRLCSLHDRDALFLACATFLTAQTSGMFFDSIRLINLYL